ncbi:hypothetical protein MNBD_GAMMA18-490 [hydrothermal vent metagenome]|uniref:Uncharacterized protein n=1 Tax=hydrothermal vent metagenome TaxID=652676 RepID=A0A3B0ZQC5_9ZZZZ
MIKLRRTVTIIALVWMSGQVLADMPYTFSSGSPARASEVNANFQSLDRRISELESQLGASCLAERPHTLTYTLVEAGVGELVQINGVDYRMIKMAFKGFGTDLSYTVKMPMKINDDGSVLTYFNTYHQSNPDIATCSTISGYPASLQFNDSRSVYLNTNGISESHSSIQYSASIWVRVNETSFFLPPYHISEREQATIISPGDYDFTDNITTDAMSHRETLSQHFDDLIDYIVIQQVP